MSKQKERNIIAIIGRTNAGKSSLLNLLSGQKDYAIVDKIPGTTTDTVVALMEIHGLGPCKVLDTAGVDEHSELGEKKRKKTFEAIEEADLNLVVVDIDNSELDIEAELIERAQKYQKQVFIIINIFDNQKVTERQIEKIKQKLNQPVLAIDVNNKKYHRELVDFIKNNYKKENQEQDLLPGVNKKGFVLLIIPMDEETPAQRLLRPQDMAVERILRKFATPVLFRLDLNKARNSNQNLVQEEFKKYQNLLNLLKNSSEGLQLVITDSQAFDIVPKWTPENIPLTSFSIMMVNYMSMGNLALMAEGARAIDNLKDGSKVLIVEACNHDRKCNDIGTVQIPKILEKKTGGKIDFEFNFGRTFTEDLKQYDLIVHCGPCMIDRQKFLRRLSKVQEAGVPITNYGILLAFTQNMEVLERAIKPFNVR
ncbi:MAG: [FeFe] hydrogenase H-cluster maturation GTPase HydF [bacterium]